MDFTKRLPIDQRGFLECIGRRCADQAKSKLALDGVLEEILGAGPSASREEGNRDDEKGRK
jgi:hypothetical protein